MASKLAFAAAAAVFSSLSFAAPYTYMVIDSVGDQVHAFLDSSQGRVEMTYSGVYNGIDPGWSQYDFPDTYTSETVSNIPTPGIIQLLEGTEAVHTIHFSVPVNDPVMSFVSLGADGSPVRFHFGQSFNLLSQGGGAFGGGSIVQTSLHDLSGEEGHGTIIFPGVHQDITFTAPDSENWYGFTVGIPGQPKSQFSGMVNLEDFVEMAGQSVTVEFINPDNQTVVATQTVVLAAGGSFIGTVPLTGTYDLAFKGTHWLRRIYPGVTLQPFTAASGLYVSCINGDVDGDNEVGLSDFGLLSNSFGTFLGDPGFYGSADLDGDTEIGLSDFGILSSHFGEIGE